MSVYPNRDFGRVVPASYFVSMIVTLSNARLTKEAGARITFFATAIVCDYASACVCIESSTCG